ncbi:MAG: hypothetical protein RL722_228 [Pseudomonadota bacterium]
MAIFPQGYSQISARCRHTEDGGAERRVLEQLKRCLEDDYLVWHNVPVGSKGRQPDFVILHPGRGLLILEVKGWRAGSLCQATRNEVQLDTPRGRVSTIHPGLQARGYATELVNQMQRDPALLAPTGRHAGKLIAPWGYGAVLANIERSRIGRDGKGEVIDHDALAQWDEVFPHERTLTREDLADTLDPAAFQQRLWGLLTVDFRHTLTLPQRDRMRWHLFPEIRIQTQASLLDGLGDGLDGASTEGAASRECSAVPQAAPGDALMQVMDLQQEQLARSMGEGHRVIHGVAGSGKTMILVYRAEKLAAAARPDWPILVLCYNRPLAARIEALIRARGIDERVQVRTFHSWCWDMAASYQLGVPRQGQRPDYDALADRVVQAVEHGRVPRAQYAALMIDEAHDFEDAWLRLAPQLVDPNTNSLLVLYDDAQSIYRKPRRKFSFASVGINAIGRRTTILKINYRNTTEVLALATATAGQLVKGDDPADAADPADDGIAHPVPMAAGRHGPRPELLRARSPQEEAELVAARITDALAEGAHPADIGVLARRHDLLDPIDRALQRHGIATQRLKGAASQGWLPNSVKLTTLHASKGLEFHTVAIVGLQALPDPHQTEEEEWRLLYVAMTRATHGLVLSGCGRSAAVARVELALGIRGQADRAVA